MTVIVPAFGLKSGVTVAQRWLYPWSCHLWAPGLFNPPLTMAACCCLSCETASLLTVSRRPGFILTCRTERRLLCLDTIEAVAHSLSAVAYCRAQFLGRSSLLPTAKMPWNYLIVTAWAPSFCRGHATIPAPLVVASVSHPVSTSCRNGLRRARFNSMLPRKNKTKNILRSIN